MMKLKLFRGIATTLAVVMTATTLAIPTFAAETVTVTYDETAKTVTASRTDDLGTDGKRLALAQFDEDGLLQNLFVAPESNPLSATNPFNLDPAYITKVITFSDFDTATAYEEHRTLGSKCLFLWDGETRRDISIDSNGGSHGMVNNLLDDDIADDDYDMMFGYHEASGTFRALDTTSRHVHMYPETISTDWMVYSFDLTVNNVCEEGDSTAQIMSAELYGGISSDYNGDGVHKERYIPISIRKEDVRTGIFGWGHDPQTQISFNNGQGGETTPNYTSIGDTASYHFDILVNLRDRYYTLYVNGAQEGESVHMPVETEDEYFPIRALRFDFRNDYDITLDNMMVYEGAWLRDSVDTEVLREIILTGDSILEGTKYTEYYDDSIYTAQIGTNKAVHANTGVVWDGSRKLILENTPWNNDGVQMVPRDELASKLGISCGSTSGSVTRESDGITYVPIESFLSETAYTHLNTATHNPNCYVLKSGFAPDNVDNFNRWMLYYRPSEDTVYSDYLASDLAGEHPRLLATEADFDRMRSWYDEYIAYDANFDVYNDETGKWEEIANYPWCRWLRNNKLFIDGRVTAINGGDIPKYESYDTVGRMNYQRKLASDMHGLAFWYQMSGDTAYAEAAWACLEALCNPSLFPDFNLGHKLDVSEAMAAIAIGYDWLYDYWVSYDAANGTDRLGTIEDCMYRNGLYFAWNAYQDGGLMSNEYTAGANHGTVGNNGALMLATALMDVYPAESAFVASQAIKCMEMNIWNWHIGTWYEGAGYWELTMQHTAKFVGVLNEIFPGGYGFAGLEGLSEAGVSEMQHHTPLGVFNYGDTSMSKYWVPEMIWLANEYEQTDLAYYMWKNKSTGIGGNEFWQGEDAALAFLWLDNEDYAMTYDWPGGKYTPESLSLDYKNDDIDVAIMRDTHDSTTDYTVVGIKGGCATDTHAQIDAGSFMFESDGIRWAQDPGAGSYLSGYFDNDSGGQRWTQLPARGESHNTIVINPGLLGTAYEDQYVANTAELMRFETDAAGGIATLDMSTVLFNVDEGATRGFFFTDNRQSLVIRDEFTPIDLDSEDDATAYWTMMVPYGVTIDVADGRITLTSGDSVLYLDYVVSNGTVGEIVATENAYEPIEPSGIIDNKAKLGQIRIPVTITNGTATAITVKLTPKAVVDAGSATEVDAYNSAISGWSL